jgi:alkylation response protein AidB-like acyl-CoA dehydrogenase
MDLELTDEQTLLAESVRELLARNAGAAAWPALVEFGALEIARGDDVGAVELALVARELGARLQATPLIDACAAAYAARGTALAADLEDATIALALLEPGGGWGLEEPATTLAGDLVDGRKVATGIAAPGGGFGAATPGGSFGAATPSGGIGAATPSGAPERAPNVDAFVVLADDSVVRRLAVVAPGAGVTASPVRWIDDGLAPAVVTFDAARADAVHAADGVLPRLMATGAVLAAAEASGAAAGVLELARQYAGERRQFGRTIGSFQALRHLLADMYVKQDSSWSTVLFAAAALDDGAPDALRAAAIAKAYVSRAAQEVAQGALQVFGGIAFTAEHPAHLYLRRILARGQQFGDARHHERAIGRTLAGAPEPVAVAP